MERNRPGRRAGRGRLGSAAGSALFFAAAPAVVAGLVPWLLTGWRMDTPASWWGAARWAGVPLAAVGAVVLVSAFVRFALEGIGTPAPLAPTRHLVVGGLYRYVRNPMYIAVVATILGQALLLGRVELLVYGVVAGAVMGGFARWVEEPELLSRFGAEYARYCREVPGWRPRLRAWTSPSPSGSTGEELG